MICLMIDWLTSCFNDRSTGRLTGWWWEHSNRLPRSCFCWSMVQLFISVVVHLYPPCSLFEPADSGRGPDRLTTVESWPESEPAPPSRCVSVSVSVLGDSLTNLQTLLSACCQQSLSCLPFHPVCVCVLYRSLCLWFSGHHLIVDSHLQRNTHCHVLTKWKVPCGFSSASHLLDKLWMSLAVTFLQFLKSWHVWNVTKVWKFPQVRGRSHFTLSTGFLLQLCSANVGQTDFL